MVEDAETRGELARFCSVCKVSYSADVRFCPIDGGAVIERDESGDPFVGRTLAGRYLVRRKLGQGGMGVVYKADHVGLDKPVAVKFLLDKYTEDREVLTRFHREARTASRIGHENIVDITDIGETEEGRSYIVMELLEGSDLAHLLEQNGPLDPARAAGIINQVLRGLAAAHEKGIIHRDMKPENVFVTRRGGQDFVKIMDFGISKIIDAHDSKVRLTETGAVVGTPIYMAPEQARAAPDMDHRVDIYAVGVMLYEMLAGQPPFMAPSYLALVTQLLYDPPPPLRSIKPDVPEVLASVVHRALAKEPSERFATAHQFAAAIPSTEAFERAAQDVLSTLPDDAHGTAGRAFRGAYAAPTARPPQVVKRRSKAPLVMIGGAVAIAAAAIAIALIFGGGGDESEKSARETPAPAAALPVDAASVPRAEVKPLASVAAVRSRPPGARVYVDGTYRGVTPIELDELGPGSHQLRIELDGYEPFETQTELRAGLTERIFAVLSKRVAPRKPRSPGAKRSSPRRPKARQTPPTRNPYGDPPERRPPKKRPGADHKKNPYE